MEPHEYHKCTTEDVETIQLYQSAQYTSPKSQRHKSRGKTSNEEKRLDKGLKLLVILSLNVCQNAHINRYQRKRAWCEKGKETRYKNRTHK